MKRLMSVLAVGGELKKIRAEGDNWKEVIGMIDRHIVFSVVASFVLIILISPHAQADDSTVTLHFPSYRSVGTITLWDPGPRDCDQRPKSLAARGDVQVPSGKLVEFECRKSPVKKYPFLAELRKVNTTSIFADDIDMGDADLVHLKGLKSLKLLLIQRNQITDEGLAHLSELTSLRVLYLSSNKITDEGLAHLRGLTSLEDLELGWNRITGAGLVNLEGMSRLRGLNLYGQEITDEGAARIGRFSSLERLSLGYTKITDESLVHIGRLTSLKRLDLSGTETTEAALLPTLKRLGSLGYLSLNPRKMTTEEHLKATQAIVPNAKIIREGTISYSVGHSPTSKADLREAQEKITQERRKYRRPQMSDDGLRELQRALPQCEIIY